MSEKTPEQLLKEGQEQLKKDLEQFEIEKNQFAEDKAAFETEKTKFDEDKKAFEEAKANTAKDVPDVEDTGNFKDNGYLVLHDLMYKGKVLLPGSRNKLAELKKEQIERLLSEKVIRK